MSSTDSILIIDDTPANVSFISEILTQEGFEVAIATTGERALKIIQRHVPSLILLDVMMPGINGFEMLSRLRSSHLTKDVPVIFMTALSDVEQRVKGLSLGAVDYIPKPLHHDEVIARIKAQLQLRRLSSLPTNQITNCSANQVIRNNAWQYKLERVLCLYR